MVYVDRRAEPQVKLRLSDDKAQTFAAETELLIHSRIPRSQNIQKSKGTSSDAWAEMGQFSIGLPDAVRLPGDRGILVVYYTGQDKDHTDVEWSRITIERSC